MKKNLLIIFMCISMVFMAVSCDDHIHTYSEGWRSDETHHWHECECGEKIDIAEHNFEVSKEDPKNDKLVKKCTVCGYVSNEEITKAVLVSTADELKSAITGDTKTIYLGDNIASSEAIELSKDLVIDLQGKTLTLNNESGDAVSLKEATSSYTVEIKNGKIEGKAKNNIFTLRTNTGLTLDNVVMNVECKRGIQVIDFSQNATINVKGSTINVKDGNDGVYVIATNANVGNGSNGAAQGVYSKDITVTISDSTLEAKSKDDGSGTALLLNVPGTYTITGSTAKGECQAAVLRGGTFNISGSTFEYTTNAQKYKDYEAKDWSSGNDVPNAAIVIGNRTNSAYEYPTNVTFSGKNTLTYPTDGRSLYIYQAEEIEDKDRSVTVTGFDESWIVNDDFNGAIVKSANGKTFYTASLKSFDNVVKNLEGEDITIKLLQDLKITEGKQRTYGKSFTLDLNEKTLHLSKELNFGYDSGYSTVSVSQTIKNGKVSVQNGGYIRFEMSSEGTFENVEFSSSDGKFNEAFKTYALNNTGVNKYTFTNCTFTNTSLAFDGGSDSINKNKYDVKLTGCTFTSSLGFKDEAVSTDVAYGSFVFEKCNFTNEGITFAARDIEDAPYDIDIKDCIFTATSMSSDSYFVGTAWTSYVYGTLDISDTTFTATDNGNKKSDEACVEIENALPSCGELLKITLAGNTFTTTSMNPFGVRSYYNSTSQSSTLTATVTLDTTNTNTFTVGGKKVQPTINGTEITWSEVE